MRCKNFINLIAELEIERKGLTTQHRLLRLTYLMANYLRFHGVKIFPENSFKYTHLGPSTDEINEYILSFTPGSIYTLPPNCNQSIMSQPVLDAYQCYWDFTVKELEIAAIGVGTPAWVSQIKKSPNAIIFDALIVDHLLLVQHGQFTLPKATPKFPRE
ncbi:hypothetical protein AB6D11_19280 [Vibrio splendidus]